MQQEKLLSPARSLFARFFGMGDFRILSASEQVAAHLKSELLRGTWTETMPGRERLMARLGVGAATVRGALDLLEDEGLLISHGSGHRRRITHVGKVGTPSLLVRILMFDKQDRGVPPFAKIRDGILSHGHLAEFAVKDLHDLQMDPQRVAAFVEKHPADAWVVVAATAAVLKWFASRPVPSFAISGRMRSVEMAGVGVNVSPVVGELTEQLLALGHRRIVMLSRKEHRKPTLGPVERVFTETLAAHGIEATAYHLPDWGESPTGLISCLDGMFKHTPPTALIFDEAHVLLAARQHLAQKGFNAPGDVSMACRMHDPAFAWFDPRISHIQNKSSDFVRYTQRWIDNVARDRKDLRQAWVKAKFVEGGTIGPPPGRRL